MQQRMMALFVLFLVLAAVRSFRVPHLSLGGTTLNKMRLLQKAPALRLNERIIETEAQMEALFAEMEQEYETRKSTWEAAVAKNMKLKKPKIIKPLKPMFQSVRDYLKFLEAKEKTNMSKEDKEVQKLQKIEERRKRKEEEAKSWEWSDPRNFDFTHDGKTNLYVPSITEPKWFAVDVTYSKADDVLAEVQKPPFNEFVTAWYGGPPQLELAFVGRGKNATLGYKKINPRKLGITTRVVYLKMIMNKDIELLMKTIDGLYFFQRTGDKYLLLPCPPFMQGDLDKCQAAPPRGEPVLSEELRKLRKGDRIEVVSGLYEGRKGTLEGVEDGQLRVELQPGDISVALEMDFIRRLEKTYTQATSVRKATESLFTTNPSSSTIRKMVNMGVLNEVLYSDKPYLDEKMVAPPAQKLTTRRKKAMMPKGPLSLEVIDPRMFVANALRAREQQARNAAILAGKEPPKKVRMPRMPNGRDFENVEDFKRALLEHDKKVRAIKDFSEADAGPSR